MLWLLYDTGHWGAVYKVIDKLLTDIFCSLSPWGLQIAGGIDYQPDLVLRYLPAAPTRIHTEGCNS